MVKKKTFLLSLSEQQHRELRELSRTEGVSMAEYIRRKVFNTEREKPKSAYPIEY